MTRVRHATMAPTDLKRSRLDNISLIPASLLPFKEDWWALAGELPAHQVLFVVPYEETQLKRVKRAMRRLVPQLRASGRQVTAVSARRLG